MEQSLTQDQKKLMLSVMRDFYKYAKVNLWIKNKDAKIVRFVPNKPQQILINYVISRIAQGKPVKAIVLKARQMGFSTAIEALGYWWTATNKNINTVIIGNDEKSAKNLYMMFRRFHDNVHDKFKPAVRYNTRTDLSFERFDESGKQVGLGSYIKTETAGNKGAGRSDTINFLHGSEVGSWENGEDLVASLLQTIPDSEYMEKPSMTFLESTAEGRGTYFHREFVGAVEGKNNFEPFFFPWWVADEYERDDGDLGEISEYESFLIDLMRKGHKVGGEVIEVDEDRIASKIHFYRRKKKDFEATPERLPQEYPSTWQEAFISSGSNVFNVLSLQEMENDAQDPADTKYYTVIPGELHEWYTIDEVPYEETEEEDYFVNSAPLKVWQEPIPGREYVIGADVAEGLRGGDYSVAEVVRTDTMETVARWRGHIDPDQFGNVIGALGVHYNWALVGVEVNNHGLTTIQRLRDTFYTNLYKRDRGYDEDFEEPTSNLGWKTDIRTKRLMINDLVKLVREKKNIDKDVVFINEAFSYVRDDRGRTNAEEGAHDDTVMAKAIAFQLFEWEDEPITELTVFKKYKKYGEA